MIKIYFFLFLSLMTETFLNQNPKKVIFFGDSITEAGVNPKGYISILNDMLLKNGQSQNYELIGSGIGGNKVYDLFFRMERDVLAKKPDIVVIWIGVNDVWHKSSHGTGTDADKFGLMYSDIIYRLQNAGIKVYCCTPACIGEKTDHSNQQDGDLNEYSKIIRKSASSKGADIIDIRQRFLDYNIKNNKSNKRSGILTTDGVHLNETGNKLVAEWMSEQILQ
ncbi:MAG: G-D-S-L family lipolytic protein [Saprospiraceae bacterium]|jgi:lysophospholipase L1-like esterase|nr:G-D-S-L family lipolytic protein [Saprospiraceae bacterium]